MTVPERFEKQLIHIAEKENTATNNLMAMLMDKALTEFIEDYFDARIGEAAIEELQRGEDTTVSLKEAMRLLNEMVD